MTTQAQMLIKIDTETKRKINRLARQEGKTTSKVVREMIEEYIQERDIAAYIDGLWGRIGAKIRSKGVRQEDIPAIIKEMRGKKA